MQELEYEALYALYHHCNGAFWKNRKNWLHPERPAAEWFGVSVEVDEEGRERVTALDLVDNNLTCAKGQCLDCPSSGLNPPLLNPP